MRDLVKRFSLTQEKIASVLGCAQSLVSKWCRGLCEPSLNAIIKMSEAFNIPIEEIVLAFRREEKADAKEN